jgi:hypothetical protein
MSETLTSALRHLTLLALGSLTGCSAITETAGAPHGIVQELPEPCDIRKLSQEQYRTCVEHTLCKIFSQHKTNQSERDEYYEQCVWRGGFNLGDGF